MFSVITHTIKLLTWDLGRDILRFPLWWYSDGLQMVWQRIFTWIFSWHNRLGVGIWIKNWFRPMYAQYDWQGRLISLFFRTIIIIYKSIGFLLGVLVYILLFMVYILAPLLAVLFFILSFS